MNSACVDHCGAEQPSNHRLDAYASVVERCTTDRLLSMSVGASAVRHDVFLLEIMTPSQKDNVPIKQSRVEALCNTRISASCWARGPPAAAHHLEA